MIVIDCIQGEDSWLKEKIGKPSASNASKIITLDGKRSATRSSYLYEMASELITLQKAESYKNENMEEGNAREQESRELYQIIHSVQVEQVGVIYKDEKKRFLCSPDGIINRQYGLELKNVLPKTQAKYLHDNKCPTEYVAQIQFSLMVTGFEFWDFLSHSPLMRPLIVRVTRDEEYISKLEKEVNLFCDELQAIVEKIK